MRFLTYKPQSYIIRVSSLPQLGWDVNEFGIPRLVFKTPDDLDALKHD